MGDFIADLKCRSSKAEDEGEDPLMRKLLTLASLLFLLALVSAPKAYSQIELYGGYSHLQLNGAHPISDRARTDGRRRLPAPSGPIRS